MFQFLDRQPLPFRQGLKERKKCWPFKFSSLVFPLTFFSLLRYDFLFQWNKINIGDLVCNSFLQICIVSDYIVNERLGITMREAQTNCTEGNFLHCEMVLVFGKISTLPMFVCVVCEFMKQLLQNWPSAFFFCIYWFLMRID